jgi:L-lactate dehydrogenase complex protein LldG
MSTSRDAIFARIREALAQPAPRHHEKPEAPGHLLSSAPFRQWLPPVGECHEERIELFARLSEALRTEFVSCASIVAAAKHVKHLATDLGWKKLATHESDLTAKVLDRLANALEIVTVDGGYEQAALEACDAGLTGCECLIAQTGSVLVTTRSSGGRALSVLPPHHIVIARRAQLLPDLTAAFELVATKYASGGYPSFMSFITGPSRTGDIERILVLGAHGPKKLTVLLVP